MVTARRTLAGIAILGLAIALVIIQQRRGDAPVVDLVDGAVSPIDDGGTARQAASAAMPATDRTPSPAAATEDEASGMCAQTLDDAAAFALMERNAATPIMARAKSNDQLRSELESLLRSLAGSPDPEPFLTTFLLDQVLDAGSSDPPDYAPLLDLGLRAASSDSSLLAWHALRACVEAEEYCPFPHLEQELLQADRDNAEAWALVATLRYRRGDVAGALAAMQDAARASTSTWYWTETIAMVERSLAAQTALPYWVHVGNAFGAAVSALPPDSGLRMCREESATNRAWGEACLAFGTLRGEHNETDMARGLAYGIRERALTALGDTERAANVAEEHALYSAERIAGGLELSMSRNSLRQVLVETDPDRLYAYLGAVREFGENEGNRMFLRQELPPLLERAGLLERDGARECIAQFFELPVALGSLSATFRDYPVEEYPIQVGDQLQIEVQGRASLSNSYRVGSDGMITMPRVPGIAAVGKTTGQLEREIATMLSERNPNSGPIEVFVILASPRSPEELQLEFDEALREAAESREEPR